MRYLHPNTTNEVKSRTDIVSLVSETVPLRRRGRYFVGLCPFHSERTPSFTVFPDTQSFYCFGCQAGGDIFDFLMKRDGLSFPEAKAALAERAGIPIGPPTARQKREAREAVKKRERAERVAAEMQALVERETARLIALERLAWTIMRSIHSPEDLEQPSVVWALQTKEKLAWYLDRLMDGDPKEQLETALEAERVNFL